MWKELLSALVLCLLTTRTSAQNICDGPCVCEESDEQPAMLTVSCDNRNLFSVPSSSSWPKNTYTMDLSRNNITSLESLEHFEEIRVFRMPYCKLQTINASVFEAYPFLLHLDLCQNYLKDLDGNTFVGLHSLKVLNISDNNIRKLPDDIFDPLVQLEELKLSGNPLRYLEVNTFKQLDNLIRLDISNIRAHSLSDGIFHYMEKLLVLDLSGNDFEDVPDTALKSAPRLKELFFSENKIRELNEDSFKDLSQLESLELNDIVTLKVIKERAFSTLKSLRVLKISSNRHLSHIDAAAFNGIYNPADISSLQLKVLILKNNNLPTVDAHTLPWCQIQTLDIQGNPWFCDCFMKWIIGCNFPAELQTDLRCSGPNNLRGRYLSQLYEEEFVCSHLMVAAYYSQQTVRTIAAITGLSIMLVIGIVIILFVKRRNIKTWWTLRRRGQGAIYYVKAETNPSEPTDL